MKKMKMFLAGFLAMSLLVSCSDGEDDPTPPGSEPVPPTPGEQLIAIDMNLDLEGVTVTKETVATGYNVTLTFDSSNPALAPAEGQLFKPVYPEITFANGAEGVTCTVGEETVALTAENGFEPVEGKANTFKVELPLADSRVLAAFGSDLTFTFKKEGAKDTVVTITMVDTNAPEIIPEDSIRTYAGADDTRTEFMIYNVKDLEKASELVNGGDTFAGKTLKVANDITINESVLKEGFLEPDEGEGATANPDLVNLDSIGKRKVPFCGTFDGNNKVISGLYIYQSHQGLALIGEAGNGAVIKNVILRDACVINNNASGAADGPDDDRFGLLVGSSEYMDGAITVENCIIEGVVGSAAAKDRVVEGVTGDNPYEYAAGIMGEVGKKNTNMTVTIKNCVAFVRNYTSSEKIIINKDRITGTTGTGAIVQEGNSAYGTDDLAAGKAAIDAAVEAARQ